MAIILLFLSVLPTIILGFYIYKNDRLEKEPIKLLITLALSGVLAVVLTVIITLLLQSFIPFFNIEDEQVLDVISLAIYVFIGIALIEEFSKWIFTYLIAWNNKAFDHIYDAIVYSVFVSLGFATIENIMYVFLSESFMSAIETAFIRMLFSVPGHAFFGVLMGYYLGLAKLTDINKIKEKSNRFLFLSLFVPTISHFLFDYLLMLSSKFELSMFLFLIFVILLFIYGTSRVKRLSNIPTYLINSSNNQIKYCSNCGQKIVGKFCSNCGHKNF